MELPITLRSSRKKAVLRLIGCLAFVAIALSIDRSVIGYIAVVFFGLGAVVFAVQLHSNISYLRITYEGSTMCSLFRCYTIQWRYVSRFGVGHICLRKVVGWDPAHEISKAGKATKALSGYVSALPDMYGMRAEDLADLLNRLRDEYAAQSI
jgi:hypothetical protein